MKTLIVYPTFLCPYSCAFCLTKDKNSLNEFLDIFKLRDFLEKNASKFDKIKISGGEPMSINYDYFNELVDTLKEFNTNIVVSSYPVELKNYRDDIFYVLPFIIGRDNYNAIRCLHIDTIKFRNKSSSFSFSYS